MKCVQDKKDATREHQLWHMLLVVRKELIDFQPETKPLTALRLPAAEEGLVTAPSPYCLTQDQNLNKTVALDSLFKYTIFSWVSSNLRSLTQSHSRPCSWSLRSCSLILSNYCRILWPPFLAVVPRGSYGHFEQWLWDRSGRTTALEPRAHIP